MSTPRNDEASGQAGSVNTTKSSVSNSKPSDPSMGYFQCQLAFTEQTAKLETAGRGEMVKPPLVTGQCAEVLSLIRQYQPLLSFVLTADHAIPEAAARVHDLRVMGFNIITRLERQVMFRGQLRIKAAFYSLGSPEWPYRGFLAKGAEHDAE